jgi:hypothetical protein
VLYVITLTKHVMNASSANGWRSAKAIPTECSSQPVWIGFVPVRSLRFPMAAIAIVRIRCAHFTRFSRCATIGPANLMRGSVSAVFPQEVMHMAGCK